jgi:hypothetical protein
LEERVLERALLPTTQVIIHIIFQSTVLLLPLW